MPAQTPLAARLPALTSALLAAFLVVTAVRTHNDTTIAIVIASVLMFACCWASATYLLGGKIIAKNGTAA
ncbi:hypothetical protein LJR129_001460 [Acidovorax sp. LjRoot129]|uniref:hypothetical protein n=1 Tax=Acidovorax sp. LjRoot129 TaxID=3342260 RepID=UPI003ED0159B